VRRRCPYHDAGVGEIREGRGARVSVPRGGGKSSGGDGTERGKTKPAGEKKGWWFGEEWYREGNGVLRGVLRIGGITGERAQRTTTR